MRLVMEQKQMLKMVMTTELRQAIELLQFSTYELLQFVQQQAEENPFIEFVENDVSSNIYHKKARHNIKKQAINPLEFATKDEKGMYEQLLEQLTWMELTEEQYRILHYMILNINEQGYLELTNEEIANHFHIKESVVSDVKKYMCRLEPLGIGTANLRECLLVQAKDIFPEDFILHQLIEKHLNSLA